MMINSVDKFDYLVFLGGSCNPTTWRKDIAIPILEHEKISFYDPQVDNWTPDCIQLEDRAKQNARVLFFVIDNKTRSISSMIETSFLAACSRKLILVIDSCPVPAAIINGEPISEREHKILRRGRHVLQNLVEGIRIPVFDNILEALSKVPKILGEEEKLTLNCANNRILDSTIARHSGESKVNKLSQFHSHGENDVNSFIQRKADSSRLTFRTATSFDSPDGCVNRSSSIPNGVHYKNRKSNGLKFNTFFFNGRHGVTHADYIYNDKLNLDKNYHLLMKNFTTFKSSFSLPSLSSLTLSSSPPISSSSTPTSPSIVRPFTSAFSKSQEKYAFSEKKSRYNATLVKSSPLFPHQSLVRGHDIYLAGSTEHNTWHIEVAIPLIEESGHSYQLAEFSGCDSNFYLEELARIKSCKVLLFVIGNKNPALETMILAGHCIGLKCKVVLCIQMITKETILTDYQIANSGLEDYNRGRLYLSEIAKQSGGKVFSSIHEAVKCVIEKCCP